MKLIIGLGNPGEKYERTRHNLGFMALERFLKDSAPVENSEWTKDTKRKSDVAMFEWQRRHNKKNLLIEKVILAKPLTFMNNSGLAVELLLNYYKVGLEDLWVVHDEIDLPLGTMKIRFGGSSAGHRGVESILKHLRSDKFWRFRLGIGVAKNKQEVGGHKQKDVDEYVLGFFGHGQSGKARELVKRCSKALTVALEQGLEPAMNQFNTK